MGRWKEWARHLKQETYALYLAYKDPRTPWYAKVLAGIVVGYALSPIDLIPDPIPVLGYVDDLVLVPLGIALAIRTIPAAVMEASREQAALTMAAGAPTSKAAAAAIVLIWLLLAALGILLVARAFG